MRRTKLLVPDQVTETVGVTPVPRYEERCNVSYVDFMAVKRFAEQVNLAHSLTPVNFSDTVVCYKDSTRKRFKSQTFYEPKVKPRKFKDTLVVFPKHPRKSFVTCVDYHIDECRKWFKTTMEFKARTYTTSKIVMRSDDTETEVNDSTEAVKDVHSLPEGPGASQVFLPRWNKEGGNKYNHAPHLVNGEVLLNGF